MKFKIAATVLSATLGLIIACNPAAVWAESEPQYHVLILHSFDSHTAPYVRVTEVFREQFQTRSQRVVSFREIYLETRWGQAANREKPIIQLMKELHVDPSPDLVVAIGPMAADFWFRHRDNISPRTPLVALGAEGGFSVSDLNAGDAGVVTKLFWPALVDNIVQLMPDVSHILFVSGASTYERAIAARAQSQFQDDERPIQIEYTNDMSLAELQARLSALGGDSAVLYTVYNYDVEGMSLDYRQSLRLAREASSVPFFGSLSRQFGGGIIGGRLIDQDMGATKMAEAALSILVDKPSETLWEIVELTAPKYDWRELKTWGLDAVKLPPGSIVGFRPPTLLEQYIGWILAILAVILIQSLLIVALLLERRRRKSLEQVRDKLGGRLISAHEDERRRLSRELHDDISQRLVRASLDAGFLLKTGNPGQILSRDLEKLHRDLAGVGDDVHALSYRLHPSVLTDLGISTALSTECQRIGKYASANIVRNIERVDKSVTDDVALCIYRIAQEALHNAVRHAQAKTITVELRQTGVQKVTLTVSDDGRGFVVDDRDLLSGLGISSMGERAGLLNGVFSIVSRPGGGTQVSVSLPLMEIKK